MPRTKLSEYSTTNSDNTDIESINIAEGCAPSGINNAIRELMVHLKEFQTGASGDAFTFAGGVLISGSLNTITGSVVLSNTLSGVTQLDVDNIRVDGNTVSSTNSNGNIVLAPNGTGDVQVDADTLRVGDSGSNATISSNGNADLILQTGNATTGTVTLADGANGNLTVALNGTGQVVVNAGAVGTPTIAPTGDLNTGIFFPAADTIAFAEGGAEAMRIDSSGQVGIGTTSPARQLNISGAGTSGTQVQINGTSASAGLKFVPASGDEWEIQSDTNSNFLVYNRTDGATRLLINTSGNVQLTNNLSVGNATPTTSGTGITFPATQSASSDANTLDDYEEGTWSPVLTDLTNDATMNSGAAGFYTKVGRLVTINGFCQTTSKGSITTGALFIKGLPFVIANLTNNYGGGTIGNTDQLAITANQVVCLVMDGVNVTRVRLGIWKATTGTDALTGSNWNNTGYVGFSMSYITST